MSPPLRFIKDIIPTTKGWSVKVLVEEKFEALKAKFSPTRYQKIVLIDEQGTRVLATLFARDIEAFKEKLQPGKTCIISNAYVKPTNDQYPRLVDNDFEWTINGSTMVSAVHEDKPESNIVQPDVSYVDFMELHSYRSPNTTINVLAVVIDKLDMREVSVGDKLTPIQEFVVVDHNLKPVVLTMWNKFVYGVARTLLPLVDKFPVLTVTRCTVSTYYDTSLATTRLSEVKINPSTAQADRVAHWRDCNLDALKRLVLAEDYLNQVAASKTCNPDDISNLSDAHKIIDGHTFSIKAECQILKTDQRFYYVVCGACGAKVRGQVFTEYDCVVCRTDKVTSKPRCIVVMNMKDATGSLEIAVFNQVAEKLIGMSADELARYAIDGKEFPIESINSNMKGVVHSMMIRKKLRTVNGQQILQYTVAELITDTENSGQETESITEQELNAIEASTPLPVEKGARSEIVEGSSHGKNPMSNVLVPEQSEADLLVVSSSASISETMVAAYGDKNLQPEAITGGHHPLKRTRTETLEKKPGTGRSARKNLFPPNNDAV